MSRYLRQNRIANTMPMAIAKIIAVGRSIPCPPDEENRHDR